MFLVWYSFFLFFTARPMRERLTFEDGSPVDNSSIIGPFDESNLVTLKCESRGGKPVPSVTWWNGTDVVPGKENFI